MFEGDVFSGARETAVLTDTRVPFAPPQPIFTRTNTARATVGGDQDIKLLFMRY